MERWIEIVNESPVASLHLSGPWDGLSLAAVTQALAGLGKLPASMRLDGSRLERLDTAGAWALLRWLRERQGAGMRFEVLGFSADHARVLELVEKLACPASDTKQAKRSHGRQLFSTLGQEASLWAGDMKALLGFFGQLAVVALRLTAKPGHFRLRSTIYHLNQVGLQAVPIIALLAFLISLVLGYQGVAQLSKFNAQAFTLDAVAVSMLREMGVLLTSIMVAGRSGSAFTAQIGVMKLNQEVDAMRTLGLDPFEVLVLPRIIAIVIALPILTFIADMVGLFGAITVGVTMLDMSLAQCVYRLDATLKLNTFWVGMIKAPVFALLIGLVGCLRGLQVKNAADEVGKQTTLSVVQAIFLIIMADAMFSILFTLLKV